MAVLRLVQANSSRLRTNPALCRASCARHAIFLAAPLWRIVVAGGVPGCVGGATRRGKMPAARGSRLTLHAHERRSRALAVEPIARGYRRLAAVGPSGSARPFPVADIDGRRPRDARRETSRSPCSTRRRRAGRIGLSFQGRGPGFDSRWPLRAAIAQLGRARQRSRPEWYARRRLWVDVRRAGRQDRVIGSRVRSPAIAVAVVAQSGRAETGPLSCPPGRIDT